MVFFINHGLTEKRHAGRRRLRRLRLDDQLGGLREVIGTGPVDMPGKVPLVALSEIGPLVLSTRSAKVATPALAIMVVVPLKLPLDPFASATAIGPL